MQNSGTALLIKKNEYPFASMILVIALILLSPFTTLYLNYVALLICLMRMILRDAKVFVTDYCLLVPLEQIYRTPDGMSLLIWLCLIASLWYFVRSKIRANSALICILALLNYLIARMQMDINSFVLCFGQLFILYVLLPKLDVCSAVRSSKLYCWSLALTSLFALPLRNTAKLIAVRGIETTAIWGTTIMRFQGLFRDPNYYATLLIVALAILCKLKETGNIRNFFFWALCALLTIFGILTYSKMFFLVFVLLGGIYIVWQFWNKRVFRGVFFASVAIIAALYLLLSENSPIAVIMTRLTSGKDLSDFTTGRTDIIAEYWIAITDNVRTFLFGYGMKEPVLRKDPHNIYLEIAYYFGVVGLCGFLLYYIAIAKCIQRMVPSSRNQNLIAKYVVLAMVAILYFALHGVFEVLTYAGIFIAYMSILILPNVDEKRCDLN